MPPWATGCTDGFSNVRVGRLCNLQRGELIAAKLNFVGWWRRTGKAIVVTNAVSIVVTTMASRVLEAYTSMVDVR